MDRQQNFERQKEEGDDQHNHHVSGHRIITQVGGVILLKQPLQLTPRVVKFRTDHKTDKRHANSSRNLQSLGESAILTMHMMIVLLLLLLDLHDQGEVEHLLPVYQDLLVRNGLSNVEREIVSPVWHGDYFAIGMHLAANV